MLFPLQKVKVFLYAWPYFPQASRATPGSVFLAVEGMQ